MCLKPNNVDPDPAPRSLTSYQELSGLLRPVYSNTFGVNMPMQNVFYYVIAASSPVV